MYIAMNRFKVVKGREAEFEEMWLNRESYLDEVPGFVEFHFLRGPERDDHRLYSSHTVWASYAAFEDWTRSEAFRKAHANAGTRNAGMLLGGPEFEGFEVVNEIKPQAS
ncbi:MAG: antibiotic biosynthesis monooxygenase family protein [Dichotomicrobium sp.]